MNWFPRSLTLLAVLVLITGCSRHVPILPVHDEVLVYDLPFDLTYLRTVDALQSVPGWDLESMVKESGLINVRNVNFSSFDDADKRIVSFMIKRIDSRKTSVELAPISQQTLGAGDLLKAISQELTREVEN